MDKEKIDTQIEYLINRIKKNEKLLRKWRAKENITCYRIYDKDIPEIPLVIDIYNDYIHAADYRTFKVENEDAREKWLKKLLVEAGKVLNIPEKNIYFKFRKRQKGLSQYEKFDKRSKTITVTESDLQFEVNLSDYLDTGLFLDHRITRGLVRNECKDARVLNLFAYTGSFTVYSVAGGAAKTVTIDMSNTYIEWAMRNLKLNDLYSKKHTFIREDVSKAVDFLKEDNQLFDIIILDPPTFSNSKRMEGVFDVQLDHVELINKLLKLLDDNGVIYFSTNFTKFKIESESIKAFKIEDITEKTIPPDFRNKKIHKCYKIFK
ncbi:MAG: hypothetical protein A2015_13575 [Spirochaetes bacterium GWF1_31_7]|nr:MAG: hypothetical protein A2Y30_11250 [Spirochaetes bacterium GWE1_32_154]OHD47925.1 MAG: hypothetical protein A2Y29_08070 [Spirochaetes bacterium GWE2_31_10]OHD49850.1 MAG: hypothetical protein A2015_13575 [Spirochaetes bacterium GWF1_31_7]OHD80648.1 MAG: hypothetical protein A2355_01225 [Spirochaetes bacterium RIFOXYB1_FULL_32_8]HBD92902.1 SAM-dependent methyltransferase [Spirochaetia bacterium]